MQEANLRKLRKSTPSQRRSRLDQALSGQLDPAPSQLSLADWLDFSAIMVENSYGCMPVPLGLASGFLIDGHELSLPLATEEPSVIAAASFAATQIAHCGGFTTWADQSIMQAHVYLNDCPSDVMGRFEKSLVQLTSLCTALLTNMKSRGGGLLGISAKHLDDTCVRICVEVNVCDAMGANLLNSCAEALRNPLEQAGLGKVLMAILSNNSVDRKAGARFGAPIGDLSRAGYKGLEFAQRIVAAWKVASLDRDRAVTHNKGIMNGISAFALASANDTRALEAAAHAWASKSGSYQPLTRYWIQDNKLCGEIELPLAFASLGGAVSFHPMAQYNLALLGRPDARELARMAAALGLAQNFAAIGALVGEGIQAGHMRLHARRLAWQVGARAEQIEGLATTIFEEKAFTLGAAKKLWNTDK